MAYESMNGYPGTMIPTAGSNISWQPGVPAGYPIPFASGVSLSDYDIELMALCIANKHPVVEGQSGCFCMLKRLAKGISKD
jgi:hypothetical protein